MKKKFSISVLIFCAVNLFAEKVSLLEQAKKFEKEKNWVYALGTYYDAIEESSTDSEEALNSFVKLEDEILKGNPGYGSFDNIFTIHEEWKKVLISAEKYWTEFPPVGVEIKSLEQKDIDYSSKTAEYELHYNYFFF